MSVRQRKARLVADATALAFELQRARTRWLIVRVESTGAAAPPTPATVTLNPASVQECAEHGFTVVPPSIDTRPGTVRVRVDYRGGSAPAAATLRVECPPCTPLAIEISATAAPVLPTSDVLLDEHAHVTDDPDWRARAETRVDAEVSESARLGVLFDLIHQHGHPTTALCLSGGGIRSATFNLGALQELARVGFLERCHYLSSVSGGGYIASWLSTWIEHERAKKTTAKPLSAIVRALTIPTDNHPLAPEPAPVRHLRRYSNYLTPRTGLLSADTWSALVIVLRNIVLNWLVILPFLAFALAVPWLVASRAPQAITRDPSTLFSIGVGLGFWGLFWMNLLRADVEKPDAVWLGMRLEHRFLLAGLLPQLLAVPFIAGAAVAAPPLATTELLALCAIWAIGTPVGALVVSTALQKPIFGRTRTYLLGDVLAATLAGTLMALLYWSLFVRWQETLAKETHRMLLAVVAPMLVLGPVLLGKTLFVGFASVSEERGRRPEHGDAEREWWARWSAWFLIAIATWTVGSAVALYGPRALDWLAGTGLDRFWAYLAGGGFATVLGWAVSALGKSSATPGHADAAAQTTPGWRGYALQLGLPLFCLVFAMLLATGVRDLIAAFPSGPADAPSGSYAWSAVAALMAALFAVGVAMGRVVNVNRFSLQAMYRNRLMRAYLGASNENRQPNPFTGFDPDDNIPLADLADNRPFPVVNVACNLVGGDELAWQQRKSASFTMSPLHCGNYRLGYRRTEHYGGTCAARSGNAPQRRGGVSLGTAMATSGAAANPNMGYSSSPLLTFVMTLFNARLGIWLGNPGPAGDATFGRTAPTSSARMIFAEAFGLTDDQSPYVNLSDGGHFDNLGVYEMVLRRVHTIVVCDAGADPHCDFDDLGNVLRKVRTDLGISIAFKKRILIRSRTRPTLGTYCAIASIDYAAVDGDGEGREGRLIYIKPTLCEIEPYDVYNYARSSDTFPHESTVDQWFSESQFESYRALGMTTIATICPTPIASVDMFVTSVESYVSKYKPTKRELN